MRVDVFERVSRNDRRSPPLFRCPEVVPPPLPGASFRRRYPEVSFRRRYPELSFRRRYPECRSAAVISAAVTRIRRICFLVDDMELWNLVCMVPAPSKDSAVLVP